MPKVEARKGNRWEATGLRLWFVTVIFCCAAAACDDDPVAGGNDTDRDTSDDGGEDAGQDTGGEDTGGTDTGEDTGEDTTPDVAEDTSQDTEDDVVEQGTCGPIIPLEDAAAALAEAICARLFDCDCSVEYTDVDDCIAQETALNETDIEDAAAAGFIYDGDCVGCSVAFFDEELGCETDDDILFDHCELNCYFFNGTVEDGDVCNDASGDPDQTCGPGLECSFEGFCEPIPCPLPPVGEGETCVVDGDVADCEPFDELVCDVGGTDTCVPLPGENDACVDGQCGDDLFCWEEGESPECLPRPSGDGDPCYFDFDCEEDLTCIPDNELEAGGACAPPGDVDTACDIDEDCQEGLLCFYDLDDVNGTCSELHAEDEVCFLDSECEEALYCFYETDEAESGTCEARLAEDEECIFDECETDLYCFYEDAAETGTCIPRIDTGEECEFSGDCIEGDFCQFDEGTGTCTPLGEPGDPCVYSFDCEEDLFCFFEDIADEFGECSGPRGDGDTCAFDLDCEEPLYCEYADPEDELGLCAEPPGDGDDCTTTCAEGFGCGPDNTCVPAGEEGGPCRDTGEECDGELLCSFLGNCVTPAGEGEDCSITDFECVEGFECSFEDLCEPPLPLICE